MHCSRTRGLRLSWSFQSFFFLFLCWLPHFFQLVSLSLSIFHIKCHDDSTKKRSLSESSSQKTLRRNKAISDKNTITTQGSTGLIKRKEMQQNKDASKSYRREYRDTPMNQASRFVLHFLLGHHAKCALLWVPPHVTNLSYSHVSIPAVNENVPGTNVTQVLKAL